MYLPMPSSLSQISSSKVPEGVGDREPVSLRPATLDDLSMIQKWDEEDYLQDEEKVGDAEYNDWNWEYELSRASMIDWRETLIAEYRPEADGGLSIPFGIVIIIDPSREESQ